MTTRPDPEQLLFQVQSEVRRQTRGRLKVFLGYASGVGKSFRMLDEARRRSMRGEDVVIGAIQGRRDPDIEKLLRHFEFVPPIMPDAPARIDTDRIIRRHPQVCVIDPLAWENPAGSRNASRWQDVEEVLEHGISVLTALNVQFIGELRDQAEQITGKARSFTVPRAFVATADEIEIVDAPPELLAVRAHHQEGITEEQRQVLSRMREMALLEAAEIVNIQLEAYLEAHGISTARSPHERLLICLTPRSSVTEMIEAAREDQQRLHGEVFVLYVKQERLSREQQALIDRSLELAREAGADVTVAESGDPAESILSFVRRHKITQIYLGHSLRRSFWDRLFGNPVDKLIRRAEGVDIHVFPS